MKTRKLPGDRDYPARRTLTLAVLDGLDTIDRALHYGERRDREEDRPVDLEAAR